MPQVVVTISGKTYRMACEEGQEQHLEALAERFDRTMKQLRDAFGTIGNERLTVMTGIMVMDELVDAEARVKALEAKASEEASEAGGVNGSAASHDESETAEAVRRAAERIEALAGKLKGL